MTQNSGRIHISEAVRLYNKTRQTFYNRINKGYIETKKVHNKVYLRIEDIEKTVSDYLEEASPETYTFPNGAEENSFDLTEEPLTSPASVSSEEPAAATYIAEILLHELHQHKQQVTQSLNEVKQELRGDIQRANEGVQQQAAVTTHDLQQKMSTYIQEDMTTQSRLRLLNKRLFFWVGYGVLVLFNILIMGLITLQ